MLDSLDVNETEPSTPQQTQLSLAAKLGWTSLILATLSICYFSHLGALGFVGPDEPRYAWIARDMAETGDWVTPRLYGKPWFEKPPLFYWGAALCFKLFGVTEAAARLPSAISALLATLAMAWLAWRIYGADTARWLLLLLPTTVGMIGFSHAAATDMPFSGMFTIAMVCAAVVLRLVPSVRGDSNLSRVPADATSAAEPPSSQVPASRTPWLALILFGFFLGLAVLAKGPAGIVLCGGAVLCWALITNRWRDGVRLFHPAAIVAFCATALPWYILCARRNPDFFRIFIIEHNFKRYLTPEFQHIQPLWFYIPTLLVAFLPWTALLVWSTIVGTLRIIRERRISSPAAFFVSWGLFCLVFFSISQSKLPGYILPTIPAICFCVVHAFAELSSVHRFWFRTAQFSAALTFLGIGLVLLVFGRASHQGSARGVVTYGFVASLCGAANLIPGVLSLRRQQELARRLAAGCAVLPVLYLFLISTSLLQAISHWDPSARTIARELKTRGIPADSLYVQDSRRSLRYGLSFYLHGETNAWNSGHATPGFLLLGAHICKNIVPATWNCEEIPFDETSTGYFLYRVGPADSMSRGDGSGEPQ